MDMRAEEGDRSRSQLVIGGNGGGDVEMRDERGRSIRRGLEGGSSEERGGMEEEQGTPGGERSFNYV